MRYREKERYDILLVEDNSGDILLTRAAFDEIDFDLKYNLHEANDGEDALNFVFKQGKHSDAVTPDLILLDLNLPKIDGLEVLKKIKEDESLRKIPVIILSTSQSETDVKACYDQYANSYITKPVDFEEFVEKIKFLLEFWTNKIKLPV